MGGGVNPVVVELSRGDLVESRHRGAVVVVDAGGEIQLGIGDVDAEIYPRSAAKPLQALVLLESGAAQAYDLGDEEIALACASHAGEPRHVELIAHWIGHLGMTPGDLECGVHWPFHEPSQRQLAATRGEPTALHNNCSGKHSGFLTVAQHLGIDHREYVAADHPVQCLVRDALAQMCGVDGGSLPYGVDGCAIPTYALPLRALALGMARLAHPESLGAERDAAARRILSAMSTEPFLVAGSGRYCTELMQAVGPRAVVKSGAEGVYTAALPDAGLGIALKCDDGASRAAELMMTAVLRRLGVFDQAAAARAPHLDRVAISNRQGADVGRLRTVGPLA
jgi:L-asparaginase II